MGYWCYYCGNYITYGSYHSCQNNTYPTPTYIPYWGNPTPTHRAYKCLCGGEFDSPRKEKQGDTCHTTKYFCPFCNKELKI